MIELRIHDERKDAANVLIPFFCLLRVISKLLPDGFSGKWRVYHGAYGYGERVCEIEHALENQEAITIDAKTLFPLLISGEQYFDHVRIESMGIKLEIGVHDSTFYFVRADEKIINKISKEFEITEIINLD